MQDGMPITVEVRDQLTHQALGRAEILAAGASERHHPDPEGRTTMSVVYLDDGSEILLTRGMHVDVDVVAPGYAPVHGTVEVRRHARAVFELAPLAWTPTADAPPVEQRVWTAYQRWVALDDPAQRADERRWVASAAQDWLAWLDRTGDDPTVARQICRSTDSHPTRCE